MSDQNGEKPRRPESPLEAVERRIATRLQEETIEAEQLKGTVEEDSPITGEDPLSAWKRRSAGKPVTLEQIHDGLIATCEYSEAAIEGGLKMASEVHEVAQTVDHHTSQIGTMTSKVESTSAFIHSVDQEMAVKNRLLDELRKDVQFLKDDVREMKGHVALIPAIKDLLGDILQRLPEPEKKAS